MEIDRTLKRVDEGVEEFDAIWEKVRICVTFEFMVHSMTYHVICHKQVYSAHQQSQKEKYEGMMKITMEWFLHKFKANNYW